MTSKRHADYDSTPNPGEVEMMATVLEGRHGVYAEHVAQFFSDWNAKEGDAPRSWAWAAVTEQVRRRTRQRIDGRAAAAG